MAQMFNEFEQRLKKIPDFEGPIEDLALLKHHQDLLIPLMSVVFPASSWETEIVGALVRYCLDAGKTLRALSLEEFRKFSEKFDADILEVVVPRHAVNSKTSFGGTATQNVLEAIQRAKKELED